MEKGDIGSMLTKMGVSGWMFLLVPAYPGCPGRTAVKWLLLLPIIPGQDASLWLHEIDTSANWFISCVFSACHSSLVVSDDVISRRFKSSFSDTAYQCASIMFTYTHILCIHIPSTHFSFWACGLAWVQYTGCKQGSLAPCQYITKSTSWPYVASPTWSSTKMIVPIP